MADLHPCPFGVLVTRMFREHDARRHIFDLPAAAFVTGDPALDLSVTFHERSAASPFGPAAGPHTQLAQNLVLSWLAGGRISELKTVQANDRIRVPRPSIDVRTVGFNVEWSQELTLEESVDEYVKASMLIQILGASGTIALAPGFGRFLFDMSLGYDFEGITSERVQAFVRGLRDAGPAIDRFRRQIPPAWRRFADLPFEPCVAGTVTLSTFHGCPPSEIERIARFLLQDAGMPTIVKLNPTLLGYDAVRTLLHEDLGYTDVRLSRDTFDTDLQWDTACALVDRLGRVARDTGHGFGVKLTNTLVVENDGDFLPPSEAKKYMSGPPLHVLAMHLLRRFRHAFGWRLPVSFSAGIDAANFASTAALGLTPITVCTDLLKPGGYARAHRYFGALARRMKEVGATTLGDYTIRACELGAEALERTGARPEAVAAGQAALAGAGSLRDAVGDAVHTRWVAEAALLNTDAYVAALGAEARYACDYNRRPPRKVGSSLWMFDCLTCDKCIPVCPNDAHFTFVIPSQDIRCEHAHQDARGWHVRLECTVPITRPHQIATFADACNDCGNCDACCPEDGGPARAKPRFFGTADGWRRAAPLDGFVLERYVGADVMRARLGGEEFSAAFRAGRVCYAGRGFTLHFAEQHLETSLHGEAADDVDLTAYHLMNALRRAVLAAPGSNFLNCLE
jgi:putative selenate reductase